VIYQFAGFSVGALKSYKQKGTPESHLESSILGAFALIVEIGGILRDRIRFFESKHRSPV
jgi:hypothetical protein